jgi:hypothetical protein
MCSRRVMDPKTRLAPMRLGGVARIVGGHLILLSAPHGPARRRPLGGRNLEIVGKNYLALARVRDPARAGERHGGQPHDRCCPVLC